MDGCWGQVMFSQKFYVGIASCFMFIGRKAFSGCPKTVDLVCKIISQERV